mgnify:CR=1 FL=1
MTVSTIGSVAEFVTNGVTTNYPFYFKFLANEDLVVTYVNPLGVSTTLTFGTHYTVNGAGKDQGGSIVTTTALAGPGQLIVSREMALFQQTSLRNQGKFLAETHEDVFDRLTMLIQQGFAIFTRALTRPFGRDYFFAENRRIASVADPVDEQDAATKSSVEAYVASVLATGQGPINNAANIVYVGVDGLPYVVQNLANGPGAKLVLNADRLLENVDRLKIETPLFNGDFVTVKSYYSGGDSGGGPFYWDSSSVETPDDGQVFKVNSITTGRWKRLFVKRFEYKASDYGIIGNAYFRDSVVHKFYADAAKTILSTDETVRCQKLFAAANSGDPAAGRKVIDLEGRSVAISSAMVVSRGYVAVNNGRLCQLTEAADAIRFDSGSSAILMYNSMTAAFSHAYSTAGAGCLVRIAACGLGQFVWDSGFNINEGGFNGWRQYGNCFMMDLNKVWINDTYSSGFYMPGAGGTTQPPVQLGGSTTTTMHRPYVTNVRTKDPAYDIGTGYDGLTMVSPAADHITQFGRFKVNGLKIEGIGYSENIRKPIEGPALVDHKFIEIQNGSSFAIDGFYASMAPDFGASPSGIKAFLDADFIGGTIGAIRGAFPADYAYIRTQGGIVEYAGTLAGATSVLELSSGRAIPKFRSSLKFSGTYAGTGASQIFTIPGMAAASEAHSYLVTKTYSFAGKYVSDTWMVSAGNGKSIVTKLQSGPDEPNVMTLTVASNGVVTLTNTGGNVLSGPWTAAEFNVF